MPLDFVSYVEAQTGQIKKLAAFAQERGYWIWFFAPTGQTPLPSMVSSTTANALATMMHQHAEELGRRTPLRVSVQLQGAVLEASRIEGKIVIHDPVTPAERIAVWFELPNRVKFKPLVGAMSIISESHDRLVEPRQALFCHRKMSDRHEYYGRGKGALSAALSILNMPENRALLKG